MESGHCTVLRHSRRAAPSRGWAGRGGDVVATGSANRSANRMVASLAAAEPNRSSANQRHRRARGPQKLCASSVSMGEFTGPLESRLEITRGVGRRTTRSVSMSSGSPISTAPGQPSVTTWKARETISGMRAFHVATNGRPGPVVIALPEDMLTDRVVVPDAPRFEPVETWPGLTDMTKLQKLLWAARAPVMLIGGSHWLGRRERSDHAICRAVRAAGRHDIPPRPSLRRAARLLCRRSRHRPEIPSSSPASKAPISLFWSAGGMGEMPSQSYSLFEIPGPKQTLVHIHPSIEEIGRLYRPHLRHQCDADRLRRFARGASTAGGTALARQHPHRARGLPGLVGNRDEATGFGQPRRDSSLAARAAAARRGDLQRRRQFRRLDPPLLPLPRGSARRSRRPPARWATAYRRRDRRKRRRSRAHRRLRLPATATS